MDMKEGGGYKVGPAATLLWPRLLKAQQGPAQDTGSEETAGSLGTGNIRTVIFGGLAQLPASVT